MAVDHANEAAAIAAGYKFVKFQRPNGGPFVTRVEKWRIGEPGRSGFLWTHEAESTVSQAAADTLALVQVNASRKHVYQTGLANTGRGSYGARETGQVGGAITDDTH
jgi:hypothetical protein